MRRETPPIWLAMMAATAPPMSSLRDLATRTGLGTSTVSRLVHGGRTSDDTVRVVAKALNISEERVWELHGKPRSDPFTLDREADRLSPTQRAAVRAVVAAMLEGGKTARIGNVQPLRPEVERTAARARRGKSKPSEQ